MTSKYASGEVPQVGDEVFLHVSCASWHHHMYTVSEISPTGTMLRTKQTSNDWHGVENWRLAEKSSTPTPKEKEVKPNYYRFSIRGQSIDVTDVIQALDLGFEAGNVVKYLARAGRKDAKTEVEDLKKAREYIDRLIEFRTTAPL